MERVIKKWGNSAAVRIPSAVFEAAKLSLDQTVDVIAENGCVVLKPIIRQNYDLDPLLEEVTPDNSHPETDFCAPVGCEVS